ncbi:MAG: hypothetical protein Q8L86_09450 [Vicinamibacterales bacterium]|nr:hypothetical protein [Vicinamibacterales bacterium]
MPRRSIALLLRLHEFVAALDRRSPQLGRQGEAAIARDGAALRRQARTRIAELEQRASPTELAP